MKCLSTGELVWSRVSDGIVAPEDDPAGDDREVEALLEERIGAGRGRAACTESTTVDSPKTAAPLDPAEAATIESAESALRSLGYTKADARARVARAVEVVREEIKNNGGDLRASKVISRALSFGFGSRRRQA